MYHLRKTKLTLALILSLVMTLSLILPAAAAAPATSKTGTAIVLKAGDKGLVSAQNVNLRAGASTKTKVVTVMKKGTAFTVVQKSGNWYKVRLASGKVGFIYGKYVSLTKTAASSGSTALKVEKTMTLATTTSTQDTGLLDVLVPAFEKKYGTSVKVVAVGTGEALEMGKQGNADVVLVHARKSEDEFVASGDGVNRKDVMYNFFFLVGPKSDPAGIANYKDAQTAMKKIAEAKATFISRGDQSGTHKKELQLWAKYSVKPQGESWYLEAGQGMGDTLMMASEKGAYTLVDSGTWYAYQDKVNLKIVVQGDKDLFNPYGVIAVNPAKHKNVHYNAAMAFINFITSPEGQKIIGSYQKNGHQLFVPDAKN